MIDARTGQPEPCPMCGSAGVRWRRRQWYDRVRNEIRYWTESLLSGVFGRAGAESVRPTMELRRERQRYTLASGTDEEAEGIAAEIRYEVERELYESRIAAATPLWFWK